MNPVIILALGLIIIPILCIIWLLYWLHKHDINISISEEKDGSFMVGGGRYRLVGGYLYPMFVFWHKVGTPLLHDTIFTSRKVQVSPMFKKTVEVKSIRDKEEIPLKYEDVRDYMISAESVPVIGVKRTLLLKRLGSKLVAWKPDLTDMTKHTAVDSTVFATVGQLYHELHENYKDEVDKKQQLMQFAMHMGVVILAIFMWLFFPKIYAALKTNAVDSFNSASSGIMDFLKGAKPLG